MAAVTPELLAALNDFRSDYFRLQFLLLAKSVGLLLQSGRTPLALHPPCDPCRQGLSTILPPHHCTARQKSLMANKLFSLVGAQNRSRVATNIRQAKTGASGWNTLACFAQLQRCKICRHTQTRISSTVPVSVTQPMKPSTARLGRLGFGRCLECRPKSHRCLSFFAPLFLLHRCTITHIHTPVTNNQDWPKEVTPSAGSPTYTRLRLYRRA